jgi:PIN domain nuclease of toxin-antitoxin system
VTVLLDAFALIALLADERAAAEVQALISGGDTAMTSVNLAEALDVLQRIEGIPRRRLDELTSPLVGDEIELRTVDEQMARDAAALRSRRYHRARMPLSLADCTLLAATGPADSLASADRPLIRAAQAEGASVVVLPA